VDDEYMTVEEFAALTSDEQHAIWKAHAERRIDAIPECNVKRYHRAQARAVLREAEAAR
jgi:hypothetical protein